jgi:PAS domain S-box-containing protein
MGNAEHDRSPLEGPDQSGPVLPRRAALCVEAGRWLHHVRDFAALVVDLDGVIRSWSRGAASLFGLTEEEAIGSRYTSLFAAENKLRISPERILADALEQDRTRAEVLRRSGPENTFLADVVITTLRDETGQPFGFLEIARDISEQHRVQIELLRSQALVWGVLNSAIDAVITMEALRADDGQVVGFRLVLVNKIAERLFDLRRDRDTGELLRDALPGLATDRFMDLARSVLRSGRSSGLRMQYDADGSVFWLDVQVARYGDGVTVTMRNVEEEHEYQQALLEARTAAEDMTRLKSALLQNVSHELRTPLTTILGFAEVLRDEVQGERGAMVDDILEGGQRLLATVNTLLDLVRLEAGDFRVRLRPVDLREVILNLEQTFRPHAENAGLYFRTGLPEHPVSVKADPAAMVTALGKIIENAIKFTPSGGVEVSLWEEDRLVGLSVRDTGIGMAASFVPRAFAAFSQESAGVIRRFEGTGVGLTIARHFIASMNGEIEITSTKGQGTDVRIRLPRPEDNEPRKPEERQTGTTPAVLVVDDIPAMLRLVRRMVDDRFVVAEARSPEEALHQVEEMRFDVLLIDINLGSHLSGIDLLGEIRKMAGYEDVCAIAMTAYGASGDDQRFLDAGFSEYLAKPFTRQALSDAIERCLPGIDRSER